MYVGVVLLGVAARGRPLGEVRRPTARVLGRGVRVLVELEHARDRAIEERAVVRHDHRAAREIVVEEALEPVEAGEVEVVRGLVEEEHVEAGEQDRGEVGPRRLPARERGHLEVEDAFGQAEVGEHRADAGVEVGGAEREVRRRARGRTRRRRPAPPPASASLASSSACSAAATPVRRAR